MPRLIISTGDLKGKAFELKEGRNTVGRLADNALCLSDPSISSHHAEVLVMANRVTLHDLNSSNGSQVNGKKAQEVELHDKDEILFGGIGARFESAGDALPVKTGSVPRFVLTSGEEKGKIFALKEKVTSVGRHVDNMIRLDDRSVSSRHAEASVSAGQVVLRDLGSSNGTFVNGQRIRETILKEADHVLFGAVAVRFELSALKPSPSGIRLDEIGVDISPSPDQISKGFKTVKLGRKWPHPMVFVIGAIALVILISLAVFFMRRSGGE